jgi:nicotinamide-nucleotide amidase
MSMDNELIMLAGQLGQALKRAGLLVATAESCTGGWLGAVLTAVPGSSHWYDRGFVTYTNTAKREMLGVKTETLTRSGAVSEPTARAMAEGALAASHAGLVVAITGIAGPGGGTPEKPVGTVCFAWAGRKLDTRSTTHHFHGDREAIRRQAVKTALEGLQQLVESLPVKG